MKLFKKVNKTPEIQPYVIKKLSTTCVLLQYIDSLLKDLNSLESDLNEIDDTLEESINFIYDKLNQLNSIPPEYSNTRIVIKEMVKTIDSNLPNLKTKCDSQIEAFDKLSDYIDLLIKNIRSYSYLKVEIFEDNKIYSYNVELDGYALRDILSKEPYISKSDSHLRITPIVPESLDYNLSNVGMKKFQP